MANRSDGDFQRAPCLFKTFAGGVARALESTDAPPNAQHLPCQVTVQVGAGAQHLDITDSDGNANVMTFAAAGTFTFRCAPFSLQATSTIVSVTVYWQPMARA